MNTTLDIKTIDMSTPTIPQLLTVLNWPESHLNFKGSMRWSKITSENPPKMATCVLLVSDKTICARAVGQTDGLLEPQLEAVWDIQSGFPQLTRMTFMGQPDTLDEEKAIRNFNERIYLLGNEHSNFAPSVPRKKNSLELEPKGIDKVKF